MIIRHTQDIDGGFFLALEDVAQELGARAGDMLAVMYSESGCRADAHNDNPKHLPSEQRWNASGLIQFMPATLVGLGWTKGHAAFRELSAWQQLPYVRRYYLPHRGHLGSVGGLYVATFLPALVKHAADPGFVLTAKNGPLGWAYAPNAAFDANGDLAITVGELEDAVRRNCRGPRWNELLIRLNGMAPIDGDPSDVPDLRTTRGIQLALARLGIDAGPADGIIGPKTRGAVVEFQRSTGLVQDGIVEPMTRAAIETALANTTNTS
jgi:hypothetical protein